MKTLMVAAVVAALGSIWLVNADHNISAADESTTSVDQSSALPSAQKTNPDLAFEASLWLEVSPCHYAYDSVPAITTQGYCIKEVFKSQARCEWYLSQAHQAYSYEQIWQHSKCVTFAQYRNFHTPIQIIEPDGTSTATAGYIPLRKLAEKQWRTSGSSAAKRLPHDR
ncbi:MAG: hypothetical protein WA736_18555 [Candidatus Acidiferrum sp.]